MVINGLFPECAVDTSRYSIDLVIRSCYAGLARVLILPNGVRTMEWVTPQHEEVNLSCEISSYANVEL
jgi:hypothetical protein